MIKYKIFYTLYIIVKYWFEITYYSSSWKNKKFNCVDCGKNFVKGFNLKIYIQTVHEKERKFICPICEKGFGKLQHLKTHSMLH